MNKIDVQRVKNARKELGLSQGDLAKKLGISKVAICWYENGDRVPTLEHFYELADILNLSLDELSGRQVNIVCEDEEEYSVKIPKKDLEILNEIKKHKKLYKNLYNDTDRMVKLIDKRMK